MKNFWKKVGIFLKSNGEIILASIGLTVLLILGVWTAFEFLKLLDNPLAEIQNSLWIMVALLSIFAFYKMNLIISKQNEILQKILYKFEKQEVKPQRNSSRSKKSSKK